MGIFDKVKEAAGQAKDKVTQIAGETASSIKASNEEAKELKKPLEGAIARYEFTYIGGLDDIPKAKAGAWGMNIMSEMFSFRVTSATKDWLYDLDIPYDDITDIRIEKRTISNTEMLLGSGNDANQQQENVVVIEYNDKDKRKATLRIEMLTGVTIYNQAAKCKELFDLLRRNDILDRLKKGEGGAKQSGGDDILGQIEKLSKLKDAGILTEEEFAAKKADLLAKL
ncbi:MAG: SHOCT domain-containing protein [Lachnospiraceae bacterium]|nr:SHOCT domain-containing protein [Ruminococcus sp.]MCM1276681.1 SHOCT domain-containing protein [Lachnospiraceae bacterium]